MSFTRYLDSCYTFFKESETFLDVPEYLRRTEDKPTLVFNIPSYLEVYKDVFSKESFEQLPMY